MRSRLSFSIPREKRLGDSHPPDKLALVKAAAWAWHEHGSGSRQGFISEQAALRTWHGARPSRYKMEAQRAAAQETILRETPTKEPPVFSTGSTLLDSYELLTLSKKIDELVQSTGITFDESLCVMRIPDSSSSSAGATNRGSFTTKRESMKPAKGSWVLSGIACRGRDDVDTIAVINHRRRSRVHNPHSTKDVTFSTVHRRNMF